MAESIIFGSLLYKNVFLLVVSCYRATNNNSFPGR